MENSQVSSSPESSPVLSLSRRQAAEENKKRKKQKKKEPRHRLGDVAAASSDKSSQFPEVIDPKDVKDLLNTNLKDAEGDLDVEAQISLQEHKKDIEERLSRAQSEMRELDGFIAEKEEAARSVKKFFGVRIGFGNADGELEDLKRKKSILEESIQGLNEQLGNFDVLNIENEASPSGNVKMDDAIEFTDTPSLLEVSARTTDEDDSRSHVSKAKANEPGLELPSIIPTKEGDLSREAVEAAARALESSVPHQGEVDPGISLDAEALRTELEGKKIEELALLLDDARREYARAEAEAAQWRHVIAVTQDQKKKKEVLLNKISAAKTKYFITLEAYRNARLKDVEENFNKKSAPVTLSEILVEVGLNEKARLCEERTKASTPEGFWKKTLDGLDWYKKLDWKKKAAFSAGVLSVGMVGGAAAVTAAAGIGIGMRLLSSGVAASGAFSFLESLAQGRRQKEIAQEKAEFEEIGGHETPEELLKIFTSRLEESHKDLDKKLERMMKVRTIGKVGAALVGTSIAFGVPGSVIHSTSEWVSGTIPDNWTDGIRGAIDRAKEMIETRPRFSPAGGNVDTVLPREDIVSQRPLPEINPERSISPLEQSIAPVDQPESVVLQEQIGKVMPLPDVTENPVVQDAMSGQSLEQGVGDMVKEKVHEAAQRAVILESGSNKGIIEAIVEAHNIKEEDAARQVFNYARKEGIPMSQLDHIDSAKIEFGADGKIVSIETTPLKHVTSHAVHSRVEYGASNIVSHEIEPEIGEVVKVTHADATEQLAPDPYAPDSDIPLSTEDINALEQLGEESSTVDDHVDNMPDGNNQDVSLQEDFVEVPSTPKMQAESLLGYFLEGRGSVSESFLRGAPFRLQDIVAGNIDGMPQEQVERFVQFTDVAKRLLGEQKIEDVMSASDEPVRKTLPKIFAMVMKSGKFADFQEKLGVEFEGVQA